jgi:hypothetical protein
MMMMMLINIEGIKAGQEPEVSMVYYDYYCYAA